jgi:uncharacterized membrane protein
MISILLVVIAIGISAYLTYNELSEDAQLVCTNEGALNCNAVNESPYSKIAGVPVALLGLLTNFFLLGLLLLEDRIPFLQEYGVSLFFLIMLFALLYSIYLVYLQAVEIEAYCEYCLAHEVIVLLLFIIAGVRLRNQFVEEEE